LLQSLIVGGVVWLRCNIVYLSIVLLHFSQSIAVLLQALNLPLHIKRQGNRTMQAPTREGNHTQHSSNDEAPT
jgi:hypothetical protein